MLIRTIFLVGLFGCASAPQVSSAVQGPSTASRPAETRELEQALACFAGHRTHQNCVAPFVAALGRVVEREPERHQSWVAAFGAQTPVQDVSVLVADVNEDTQPEYLVLISTGRWTDILTVLGVRDGQLHVDVWDEVSARYGTPGLEVHSGSVEPPIFGFPELVGQTGTGVYDARARYYQWRAGRYVVVFEPLVNVTYNTGPGCVRLASEIVFMGDEILVHDTVRIVRPHPDWPDSRTDPHRHFGSVSLRYRWSEQESRYQSLGRDQREASAAIEALVNDSRADVIRRVFPHQPSELHCSP